MRPLRLATLLISVLMGLGCAVTGRSRVVDVEAPMGLPAPVAVAPVEAEPGYAKLHAVGTYPFGKPRPRDLETLGRSLSQTLGAEQARPDAPTVHVVMRRVLVETSNADIGVIACVAWALVAPDGTRLAEQQVYAAEFRVGPVTIGRVKNTVHEGLVRHLAQQSARVLDGEAARAPAGPYVFASFEEAAARFPGSVRAVIPTATAAGGLTGTLAEMGPSHRAFARVEEPMDWSRWLAR
ncbi:MAG: hypothetical protein AAF721_08200 [Myxococcota bacterium]